MGNLAVLGPWRLATYIAFQDETRALAFEKYLKSGSGHAFANRIRGSGCK
jgi:hypothetical protein